jgi:competence protein CoiA
MKYAFIDGQRQEAQPGRSGVCPACDNPMVAKCGDVRIHHWAHRGGRGCDSWWENETEWHRNWKNQFPINWQEVVHPAENGEKHIADVKTDQEWVLEFQHSKIHPDEHKAREAFYQKLVWIVDGARRKRDKAQFFKALKGGRTIFKAWNLLRIPITEECALLRDWTGSRAPVFFDFSGDNKPEDAYLWCLIRVINEMAYVGPFLRDGFIKYHSPEAKRNNLDFSELFGNINEGVKIIAQPRLVRAIDPLMVMLQHRERQYQGRPWRRRRL